MKYNRQSSEGLALIDRRSQAVVNSVPYPDDQNPNLLPSADARVWHYLRFDFFQALLKNKGLWLTRLDQQSDKLDGTYSEENFSTMTPIVKQLLDSCGFKGDINSKERQLKTNETLRKRAFIHCWSLQSRESPIMWNVCVPNSTRSVAIQTTVQCLMTALDGQAVDFQRIIYCPTGVPRLDFSYTAPFSAKDKTKFENERELRILSMIDLGAEEREHLLVPINLNSIHGKVVVHPLSPTEFKNEVHEELLKHFWGIRLTRSVLNSRDFEMEQQARKALEKSNVNGQ